MVLLSWLGKHAQYLLLPETDRKANEMNMSYINTSLVIKHTKEEGGDFSASYLSEAKGTYKCSLLLAKTVFGKKKKKVAF